MDVYLFHTTFINDLINYSTVYRIVDLEFQNVRTIMKFLVSGLAQNPTCRRQKGSTTFGEYLLELLFWVALRSCYLSSSLCNLFSSKFSRIGGSFGYSRLEVRLFAEDVPDCFLLKPTESTVQAISSSRFIFVVVNLRPTKVLVFCLLNYSSLAAHSLESSSPI